MRIAMAGLRHWHAAMHLDAAAHAGAELVGAWDPDGVPAAGVPVASSLAALLALRPDLAVVMGHPASVPAIAQSCIAAGVPILLEKPAASTTAELESLVAAAERHGVTVAVPLANRCSPVWPVLDRLRGVGRAGPVSHAQFRIINGPPSRYHANGVGWVLDPLVAGGGALRNLGLHAVDAALMLFGDADPAVAAAAIRSTIYGGAVEEYAVATLTVPGGAVVTVEAGYTFASTAAGGDFEWRVSTGNAYLVDRGDTCRMTTLDDGATLDISPVPPGARYRAFMAETLDRLGRGAPPLAALSDYVRAMRVIDRIYAVAGR